MNLTFWPYGVLTLLIAAAISLGLGWVAGSRHVQARCDSAAAEQRPEILMRPPKVLRSLPLPEPSPPTTKAVTKTPST